MRLQDSKFEILLTLTMLILLLGVMWVLRSFNGSSSQIETVDIVYDMPRPVKSDIESDFSLGDREIIRQHIAYENKQALDGKKAPVNPNQKKIVGIPPKKGARVVKPATLVKKPQLKVQTANRDQQNGVADKTPEGGGIGSENPAGAVVKKQDEEVNPQEPEDKKLTVEEWKSLLMTQPTRENMNKFIEAVRNKEVDQTGFYQIMQAMIDSKKKETQAAALYGIQQIPHLSSFSTLAKNYDVITAENKVTADQALLSYGQSNRLGILAQALKTRDLLVVKKAAEVITVSLEKAKKTPGTQDPRQLRGEVAHQNLQPFHQFVPLFQQWLQSGDPQLSPLANQFLTQWQG